MTRVRFLSTLVAVVVLTGPLSSVANAQSFHPKLLPLTDTIVQLPGGVSLYSKTQIWVDTAEQYSMENQPKYDRDSTRALLSGIKLTQTQMAALDKIDEEYLNVIITYSNRRNVDGGLSVEASRHRYMKLLELLQRRHIPMIRAILTPDQRVIYDKRVKALTGSGE